MLVDESSIQFETAVTEMLLGFGFVFFAEDNDIIQDQKKELTGSSCLRTTALNDITYLTKTSYTRSEVRSALQPLLEKRFLDRHEDK